MHRVDVVAGEEAVAAAETDAARPMERQDGDRDVEPQPTVEPGGGEAREIDERMAHAIPRDADEPAVDAVGHAVAEGAQLGL